MTTFSALVPRDAFLAGDLTRQMRIDLRAYFEAIRARNRAGDEFPYDLDELVPTVFARKEEAVRALLGQSGLVLANGQDLGQIAMIPTGALAFDLNAAF